MIYFKYVSFGVADCNMYPFKRCFSSDFIGFKQNMSIKHSGKFFITGAFISDNQWLFFNVVLKRHSTHCSKITTEHSNLENSALVENLNYEENDEVLQDFTKWLSEFVLSEKFYLYAYEFLEIERRLKTEPVGITRSQLVSRRYSLLDNYWLSEVMLLSDTENN